MKTWMCRRLSGAYTVEAAGVMSVVLLTIMILLSTAFHIHQEVLQSMKLHTSIEQARHAITMIDEKEITMQAAAGTEVITITAPVFRPEESLRMWSLLEGEDNTKITHP